jgi:HD-GYP domain-containing protein (c-di-GMP phosphodiesterase class II)
VGNTLKEGVRASDVPARIGGDEFLLLLPGADAAQAEQIVIRLRREAAAAALSCTGGRLSVSAGVAAFPHHATEPSELKRLADGALYWAKRSGRDRHAVFMPESGSVLSAQEDADALRRESLLHTVHGLAAAVDAKDGSTHRHSQRVAGFAGALARRLGLPAEHVTLVETAGLLHDVGKIGVPTRSCASPAA